MRLGAALAVAGCVHCAVNARLLRRPHAMRATRVSVLIPARNEAESLASCLASVADQDVAEVIVLDDESSDGTRAICRGFDVQVVAGRPLPPGWLGKPWACAQLAAAADPSSDLLVFLDADVRLEPNAIALACGLLGEFDLVSPHPRQVAVTAAERLVQPLLEWSILTFLPLRLAERSPRPSLAAANGQFLVVRRAAYERAGGHARTAVLDDLALLRAIKRTGGRGVVVDGSSLASCRMYAGWPELRDGYAKSLWSAFGSPAGAAGVLAVLGVAYVLPPLAMLRGSRAGAVGYLAAVAARVISARRTGGRAWPDALAHPVSIALLGYLTAYSHLGHRRGTLRWKGRPLA